jgi:hypothetical protein
VRRGLCRAVAPYVLTRGFAPNLGQPNLRNGRYAGAKRRLIPVGKAVCLPIVMTLEAKLPSESLFSFQRIITFFSAKSLFSSQRNHYFHLSKQVREPPQSSFVIRQSSIVNDSPMALLSLKFR